MPLYSAIDVVGEKFPLPKRAKRPCVPRKRTLIFAPEVARITGAQTSHISRLESGYRSVGLDYLEEFCDALGVDPLLMLVEDPEDTMILAGKRIRKWLT